MLPFPFPRLGLPRPRDTMPAAAEAKPIHRRDPLLDSDWKVTLTYETRVEMLRNLEKPRDRKPDQRKGIDGRMLMLT